MVRDKGNWVDEESQWDDEVQAKGKTKSARVATASHAMDIIGHVAHSTATGTHKKVDVQMSRTITPYFGSTRWVASREKTGRRRQQLIL